MKSIIIFTLVLAGFAHAAPTPTAPTFANLSLGSVSRNMTTINSLFLNVSGGSVTFNNKTLKLVLNRRMPICPPGRVCAMAMPAPLNINLQVTKVSRTACAVTYTASTPANVRSTIYETVTLNDYTRSTCPQMMNALYAAGDLTYSVTGISSLSKKQETAKAQFTVTDGFVRAQN